jgi:hypothetical protein
MAVDNSSKQLSVTLFFLHSVSLHCFVHRPVDVDDVEQNLQSIVTPAKSGND